MGKLTTFLAILLLGACAGTTGDRILYREIPAYDWQAAERAYQEQVQQQQLDTVQQQQQFEQAQRNLRNLQQQPWFQYPQRGGPRY